MNQLQLYITMSHNGFKHMVDINKDDAVALGVYDLEKVVGLIDYPQDERAIFYMIRYAETGMFVVVIRTIPSKTSAHLASWIYIPYAIEIGEKDIYDAVEFVTKKVSQDGISADDLTEMKNFFSRTFPTDQFAPRFAPNEGTSIAYRNYGANTATSLKDLIGPYRYQTSYLRYSGTLLIDSDITTKVSGTDLTSSPMELMSTLIQPSKLNVDGYTPRIYNMPFDRPFFVPRHSTIDIVWTKPGFPDKRVPVNVTQNEMRAPELETDAFAGWGQPVRNDSATQPKGNTWTPTPTPTTTTTPEAKPSGKSTGKSDLPQRQKVYQFEIPSKSASIGTVIEFTIYTDSTIDQSPIDGYEAEDIKEGASHINRLHYKGGSTGPIWTNKIVIGIAGLILGMLLQMMIGCGRHKSHDAKEPENKTEIVADTTGTATTAPETATEQPAATQPQAQQPQTDSTPTQQDQGEYSLAKAINYLDSHRTWNKEEMEKYPDLRGLFDDMNNIRRDKLLNEWAPKLADSREFSTNVVKFLKQGKNKKPKQNPVTSTNSFNLTYYYNTIDP